MEFVNRFEVIHDPNDYFDQLDWNDRLAIAASHELSISSTSEEEKRLRLKETIHCFKHPENIHKYSVKMLANKNFSLLMELNRFIQGASESGCIEKWLKSYRLVEQKQPIYQYATTTVEHFLYIIAFLFWIVLFAFSVIVIERYVHAKVRTPDTFAFWRYFEMLVIDSDRHFLLDDLDWSA